MVEKGQLWSQADLSFKLTSSISFWGVCRLAFLDFLCNPGELVPGVCECEGLPGKRHLVDRALCP